jgi:hypothetical protein
MKPVYWLMIAAVIGVLVYLIVRMTVKPPDGPTGTVAVKCGNNTVYRYSNPDEAFPEMTRDYETSFQLASGVLGKLAGDDSNSSLSVDAKNTARQLIDTLNQENIFYQTTLKAYFIESNNVPCDDSLRNRYLDFIREMADNELKLKEFMAQVSTPASQAAAPGAGDGKVLAVIDTAKAKVDTGTHNLSPAPPSPQSGALVVMKNTAQLNSAVNLLANKYRIPVTVAAPLKKTTLTKRPVLHK